MVGGLCALALAYGGTLLLAQDPPRSHVVGFVGQPELIMPVSLGVVSMQTCIVGVEHLR